MENIALLVKAKHIFLEYQKTNNIKKMCVTNCQIYLDLFTELMSQHSNVKLIAKAVIVVYTDKEKNAFCCCAGHIVLMWDDGDPTICEISHEINILVNPSYYDNVKDFMNDWKDDWVRLSNSPHEDSEIFCMKDIIATFLRMTKIAERMNTGEFIITNKKYYRDTCKYLQDKLA